MATGRDLPRDIGQFIRELRRNARISLRQLADQAGVSNPYLSQIERGLRRPSAEVLQQLASALRVSTPLMYLRAGLLDAAAGHGVLAAIAVDADLTVLQKQALSQIYETFRRENARASRDGSTSSDAASNGHSQADQSDLEEAAPAQPQLAKSQPAKTQPTKTQPTKTQRPATASTAKRVPVRSAGPTAKTSRTTKGATSPRTNAPKEEPR